ncbi:MAG: tail fiber domain-containing protein [Verrucomicrobiota bacterium]|nr:tail fiber domain-containing protein [Verrucomicrobiota bacterium]
MKRPLTQRFAALLALLCLALVPVTLAVEPPPGGGYPTENTALGEEALFNLSPGSIGENTALGFRALFSNTQGASNTAVGDSALFSNLDGGANVGVGFWALHDNTTGSRNVAVGDFAMVNNTTADNNTAIGDAAMQGNTTGFYNVAAGSGAMNFNTSGSLNTALGAKALGFNGTGGKNTAVGYGALNLLSTGEGNTAIGTLAGLKLTTEKNNIDIGHQGVAGDANTIRIGTPRTQKNAFIAGISGVTVASGVGVVVDQQGHLGTVTSSSRYKEKIQPMKDASEALLALKPVTFRYKKELDPAAIPQFGLVAEEVAKVDPDLVARDEEGKPYTVRYEAVNAMLLNEFLKAHRQLDEQRDEIDSLKASMTKLQATLEKMSGQ